MAIEFRCSKCMKVVNVTARPGKKVRCPHCGKKVVVPAALASLPTPQVPDQSGASGPAAGGSGGDKPPGEEELEEEPDLSNDAVMAAMANIMPWVISVFLHVGLMLIMVFAVMIVVFNKMPERVVIPDAALSDTPGGRINPGEGDPDMEMHQPRPTDEDKWSRKEGDVSVDTGKTDKRIDLIGRGVGGASGGGLASPGLTTGGRGSGPRSDFLGSGGSAHHVVFVIDKSGSMAIGGVFDHVRQQMLISISKLREIQDFHVILFADGPPDEFQPRRLVPGSDMYKENVAKWLKTVQAHSTTGATNPVPSLVRAFAVLRNADTRRKGKLIYLLTDGVFLDNALVLRTVTGNRSKDVFINTYLYGFKPPEAVALMKKIASVTRGKYKYVSRDE